MPGFASDPARRARYHAAALAMLTALCSPTFLAIETPGWEGVLRHGVYHERRQLGVDESVMWGDYFFVEALDRALGGERIGAARAGSLKG